MQDIVHARPGPTELGLEEAISTMTPLLPGWALFPTRAKRPLLSGWAKAAAVSPEGRHHLAAHYPRRDGWAVACKPSGILTVDLDEHDPAHSGKASWVALLDGWHGTVTPGAIGLTSTGGMHLHYRHDWNDGEPWPSYVGLRPGLDLRGGNGSSGAFAVISGPGRVLRHLGELTLPPAPLIAAIRARMTSADEALGLKAADKLTAPAEARLAGLLRVVGQAQPGGRNAALYWAARHAADLPRRDLVVGALTDAARAAGLSAAEITATIRSGLDHG